VPTIRPYRPSDRAAVDDICIRTADAGRDARGSYEDPTVLPAIFAAPYAHLEPELAFVLDDAGQAVGYVIGAADTSAFVRRFREEWLPLVADRYPQRTTQPTGPDEVMLHLPHTPERMIVPELASYPAHLHIDLLPDYQRAGHGRTLVHSYVGALHRAGVAALHVARCREPRGEGGVVEFARTPVWVVDVAPTQAWHRRRHRPRLPTLVGSMPPAPSGLLDFRTAKVEGLKVTKIHPYVGRPWTSGGRTPPAVAN
jgi:GNAT superfamily N-acetyltransferase